MSRRIRIPVRALGSEIEDPEVADLATWIATHRGIEADLITYKLEASLRGQEEVDIPAAGGRFYLPRILSSLTGLANGVLRREPALDPRYITLDAERITSLRNGTWCAFPAPHLWGVEDRYYHDHQEYLVSLCRCTKQLMRSMRDRGIKGHILLCDRYLEEEADELAGPKVRFYAEDPTPADLSLILEYQRSIAVTADRVAVAFGLLDEFEIARLTIVDPSTEALREVQSYFDPGSIEVGGYCRKECPGYWERVIKSAFILR
jgi:hypothetical protein